MGFSFKLLVSQLTASEIPASAARGASHIYLNLVRSSLAIEAKARRRAGYRLVEDVRYNERGAAERVNGWIKDDFGAKTVRVRGAACEIARCSC